MSKDDLIDVQGTVSAVHSGGLYRVQCDSGQEVLAQLSGRVLVREVAVQYDVPAFDNSAMDGYAINGDDHASWLVVHRIAAGDAGAHLVVQESRQALVGLGGLGVGG